LLEKREKCRVRNGTAVLVFNGARPENAAILGFYGGVNQIH
jgi:hypothetical protein